MRPPSRLLELIFSMFLAAMLAPVTAAPAEPSTPGALRAWRPDGTVVEMPLRHTKVTIEVTAFVARASVEQVFSNPFDDPVEAVYTFPLGDRAAVDDFELQVGERTIRGEIQRREEARSTYERARAAGHQAALLEQERPNIFVQSVANLEPGKAITVRLRTIDTLRYERGIYRLTFPLVVGPRYMPGGSVAEAAPKSFPILPPDTRSGHDVEIEVTIAAGVPLTRLESPSHKTVVKKGAANAAVVRLAEGDTIPNKDFLLRWSVASERPAVALLAHRDDRDGFFTLLVQPKGEVGPAEAMPKEITFVLDTSGSMGGIPIEASKRFVARALHALGPRDTFNLIRFAGDNEVYAKDPIANNPDALEPALAWLGRQQGAGGTEMLPALQAAFARPIDPNRLRVVVFLTDGYVGNEFEILAAIGKVVGGARIYTVGIGSSVNHHLLDRMADVGRGSYVFVRPDDSADDALEAFRSWVTLPYVTDLAIDWGALPIADLSPERLRDLGSGETLTVVGRYLRAGEGNVVVRGKLGGRFFESTIHVVLPEREAANAALSSLWARGRIEQLMRGAGLPVPASVEAEVTELALAYRLMSPYTSFVAVDDSRVANPSGSARCVEQAVPLPEGMASGAGAEFGRAQGAFEQVVVGEKTSVEFDRRKAATTFSSEFIADLPVAGRSYQDTVAIVPAIHAPDGDGNPNVQGARERDFRTKVGGLPSFRDTPEELDRLREAAFRVLADLAEDGKLSSAEGKPALAALLAAQHSSGAIASDAGVHAIGTWALAEAAINAPGDAPLAQARDKALNELVRIARSGGPLDDDAVRWVRLVLGSIRPDAAASLAAPEGAPSKRYAQLVARLDAGKSGMKPPPVAGRSPFERLIGALPRGYLKVLRA